MSPLSNLPRQPSLFRQTDQWFHRARASLLGTIPCRKGCSRCCIGPFPITILDREEIRRGLEHLPAPQRQDIAQRAREQVAAMEVQYPRLKDSYFLDEWDDALIERLVTEFAETPCPALQSDESCGIYESRPLTCRTMGLPTEEQGLVQGACEIQTFVPARRLSSAIREQEQLLARQEAIALEQLRQQRRIEGEELLVTYGFV